MHIIETNIFLKEIENIFLSSDAMHVNDGKQ